MSELYRWHVFILRKERKKNNKKKAFLQVCNVNISVGGVVVIATAAVFVCNYLKVAQFCFLP